MGVVGRHPCTETGCARGAQWGLIPMGKRGPSPKPTAIKRLEGNPGKRALNDREPEPEVGVGEPPDWLPDDGKAHWHELAPKLESLRVLTEVDRPVFAQLCQVWASFIEASRRLDENDRIYVADSGYSQITAYASDVKALRAEYLRLAGKFGMTASDRTGIKVQDEPGAGGSDDPLRLTA